jgi:dihydropteroate synthase
VAYKAIEAGADIINDIAGGDLDKEMFDVVAQKQVPYVMMHMKGTPQKMLTSYANDDVMSEVFRSLGERVEVLHEKGVADVIIDPGFGFGKDMDQNYAILRQLGLLSVLHAPILVGISRKSMLYKPLGLTPSDVLPATIAANTLALERGAHILRVHDVAAAKQAITIYSLTHT